MYPYNTFLPHLEVLRGPQNRHIISNNCNVHILVGLLLFSQKYGSSGFYERYYTQKLQCKRIFHRSQWFQQKMPWKKGPKIYKNPLFSTLIQNFKKLKKADSHLLSILGGVKLLQLFRIPAHFHENALLGVFFGRHFLVKPLTSVKNLLAQQFLGMISLI